MVGRRAVIGVWLSHRWQLCPSCGYCIFLIFLYSVAYQRVYIFFIRLPKFIPSLFFGEDRLSVGAIILSRKGQIGSQVLSFQVWISNYISRFKIFNVLFSLYFVCICLCYVLSVHVCLICLFQYWFCLVMTFIFKISFIWVLIHGLGSVGFSMTWSYDLLNIVNNYIFNIFCCDLTSLLLMSNFAKWFVSRLVIWRIVVFCLYLLYVL